MRLFVSPGWRGPMRSSTTQSRSARVPACIASSQMHGPGWPRQVHAAGTHRRPLHQHPTEAPGSPFVDAPNSACDQGPSSEDPLTCRPPAARRHRAGHKPGRRGAGRPAILKMRFPPTASLLPGGPTSRWQLVAHTNGFVRQRRARSPLRLLARRRAAAKAAFSPLVAAAEALRVAPTRACPNLAR